MTAAILLPGCANDGANASDAESETGTTTSTATNTSPDVTSAETTVADTSTTDASTDTSTSATETGTVSAELLGAVAKGPFLIGSSIEAADLDENLSPTGSTFSTQTLTDLGEFELAVETGGRLSIEAVGFYYNEVTGELSGSSLTLRAFYEANAEGEQPAFVNVVTHLAYGRVQELYGDGVGFTSAVSQAEDELLAALGVGIAGFDPGEDGTAMNLLGGDTDANAYLFAVATVLAQAAVTRAGGVDGPVDANLQEIINTISDDIRMLGQISPPLRDELLQAQRDVDPAAVMAAFAQRLLELRSAAEVPDLDRILDSDLDGIVNRDDNCPFVENADQLDSDKDDVGDACECGNGAIDIGEVCDDDNVTPFDGCEPDCTPTCVELVTGDPGDAITPLGMIDDVLVYVHDDGESVAYALAPDGEPESLGTFCNGPLFALDGIRFALGCSGETGGLWATDGTPAGTQQLVDVDTPSNIGFVLDDAFLFGVYTGAGYELWRSDGTVGGTMVLGPGAPVVAAATLAGAWYFRGEPGATDTLWSTDATGPGTQLVYDFASMNGSVGLDLVALDDRLLTFAGAGLQPLWGSDGTPGGTENLAVSVSLYENADVFAVLDGVAYFGASQVGAMGLWRSTGSAAGTSEVLGLGAASGTAIDTQTVGDRVMLIRTIDGADDEIWTSDGTPGGTASVPVGLGELLVGHAPIGDHYYFQADDGSGPQMWRTDGTEMGTALVLAAGPDTPMYYSAPVAAVGHAYISAVTTDGVSPTAALHRCAVPM